MSLSQLFIIAVIAVLVGQLKKGRTLGLLAVSAFIIYWLQPPQDNITFTYWLPTATLIITILTWLLTSAPEMRGWKQNLPAISIMMGIIILFDLNRYFHLDGIFVIQTPRPQLVAILLILLLIFIYIAARFGNYPSVLSILGIVGLIVLFVFIKLPSALSRLFEIGTTLRGKETSELIVLSWLGFSYVTFRLLHTILDRRAGRLPSIPLADYVNYVIFFPSFVAGPIDRIERFTRDLNNPVALNREDWIEAGKRVFLGLFKKFVIADSLAWIALNNIFVQQITSPVWMWILLYSYSLRIYFDFSGYTDMAIGLGRILGVCLPENFASPYLKPNLTQFWNAWHMTLTQWFRSYFFNPLTRALRQSKRSIPMYLILFIVQISTMALIGLWHGITLSFVLWGLWHGLGLFVQNRWSDFMKNRTPAWGQTYAGQRILRYSGIFLTFNFVSLGWLFFTLSNPAQVWKTIAILFGVA